MVKVKRADQTEPPNVKAKDDTARHDDLARGEYTWEAGEYGEGQVTVKIADVLDETPR
jgi:hypothetical protein